MTSIVDETRNSPMSGHGHMTYIWTFLSSRNRHFSFRLRQFSATFSSRAPPLELRMLLPELEDGGKLQLLRRLVTGRSLKMDFYCHKFPLPPNPRKEMKRKKHLIFPVLPPFSNQLNWIAILSSFFQASIELLLTSLSNCLKRIVEIEVFFTEKCWPNGRLPGPLFRHRFQLNLAWQIWKTQLDAWNFSQTNEAPGNFDTGGRKEWVCCNFFQVCHYLRSEYSDAQETFNEQCWPQRDSSGQLHLCLKSLTCVLRSWRFIIYNIDVYTYNILCTYSLRTWKCILTTFRPPSPRRTHLRALKTASPLTSPMTIPVKLARILSCKIFTLGALPLDRFYPWSYRV